MAAPAFTPVATMDSMVINATAAQKAPARIPCRLLIGFPSGDGVAHHVDISRWEDYTSQRSGAVRSR
jgi:hypothetical protein